MREVVWTPVWTPVLTCVSCGEGGRPPPEQRRRYASGMFGWAEKTSERGLEPPKRSLAKIGLGKKIWLPMQLQQPGRMNLEN